MGKVWWQSRSSSSVPRCIRADPHALASGLMEATFKRRRGHAFSDLAYRLGYGQIGARSHRLAGCFSGALKRDKRSRMAALPIDVGRSSRARVVKGEPERSVSEVAARAAPNTSPYVSNRMVGVAVHAVV